MNIQFSHWNFRAKNSQQKNSPQQKNSQEKGSYNKHQSTNFNFGSTEASSRSSYEITLSVPTPTRGIYGYADPLAPIEKEL